MNQPDMNEIMARAAEMQQQLQQAQNEIMATEVTGEAGNGLVSVKMSGAAVVQDISIDPQVVDPEDVETLQDLVLGAIEDAHAKASKLAEEKMGPFTQGGGGLFG